MQNYSNASKRKVHTTMIYRCQYIRQLCTKPKEALPVMDLYSTTPAIKKTAVWASLKSMIDVINLDVDKLEHLYLITDSPSSQYRNAGCAFLPKKFAEYNKIDVLWIFT